MTLCRSFSTRAAPARKKHYDIKQPVDHHDTQKSNENPASVLQLERDPTNDDIRKSTRVAYYYPPTAITLDLPEVDFDHEYTHDELRDQRDICHVPEVDNTNIVITSIMHGDCFEIGDKGIWQFIGISDSNEKRMVFAEIKRYTESIIHNPPKYRTYLKSDFAFKLSTLNTPGYDIKRIQPQGKVISEHTKPNNE